MDRRAVHDFLTSRRARITPEQVGRPTYGERRRVPGLRREEVASLAGVSFDYYPRLERGDLSGVSDAVLKALSRALRLDEAERQHLFVRLLDPYAQAFIVDWETVAQDLVGALGGQAGRDPSDRGRSDPIGELVTRSEGFAARWARQDVRLHRTARKCLTNRVGRADRCRARAGQRRADGHRLLGGPGQPGRGPADTAGGLDRHCRHRRRRAPGVETRPEPAG